MNGSSPRLIGPVLAPISMFCPFVRGSRAPVIAPDAIAESSVLAVTERPGSPVLGSPETGAGYASGGG
jgi:hypothetical protein